MSIFFTIMHILAAVSLILFVLLQAGKGGGIGAAFGGGSSDTLFGSSGPAGILGKLTTVAAILFMTTSLLLSFFGARNQTSSLVPDAPIRPQTQNSAPAKPGAAAPQSPETGKSGSR